MAKVAVVADPLESLITQYFHRYDLNGNGNNFMIYFARPQLESERVRQV